MTQKVFLSALLSILLIGANAQFRKIPLEVTNAFKAKYPDAINVAWKGGISSYRATFDLNNVSSTAEFNNVAQWVKTETRLTYDKLPTEVSDGLHKSLYNGWEYTEILKIEEKGKEPQFRLRVKKNSGGITRKYLFFNASGQLLKEAMTI